MRDAGSELIVESLIRLACSDFELGDLQYNRVGLKLIISRRERADSERNEKTKKNRKWLMQQEQLRDLRDYGSTKRYPKIGGNEYG